MSALVGALGIVIGGVPSVAIAEAGAVVAVEPAPTRSTPDGRVPFSFVTQTGLDAPSPAATPIGFELVYPTDPWIYTAEPGTRYLDARDRLGSVLRHHLGIDTLGGVRQPIFAAAAGTVVGGTWGTTDLDGHGFGNQVEIAHSGGYATRYAHLAEAPLVQLGDEIAAGQLVGFMGGSQRGDLSALPRHLHFEVTKEGTTIDPATLLSGASGAPASGFAGAAPLGSPLYEIRPSGNDSYVSTPTGLRVDSSVFAAVAMGGDSAQIMVSEGGTLKQLAVVDGVWTKTDTRLPLDATSVSGANTGRGFPELLAVEDGKLFHIVGDAAGWTKTWTGHYFSGTVSAARLPGDQLHALLQQAGYLYHMYPSQGGLWNVVDTRRKVGEQVDAVYVGGSAPDAMSVIDGQIHRITRGGFTWDVRSTGLPASGPVAAVYQDGGWPIAVTVEGGAIGLTRVVDRVWMRYAYGVTAPGPIDAAVIGSVGTVIYSIG